MTKDLNDSMNGCSQCELVNNSWTCAVCGKKNHEDGKIQRLCLICGREKGYVGSKRLQVLNQSRVDLTPNVTVATKDEMAKVMEKKRLRLQGYEGKQSLFLSNKADYETIEKTEIRDELNNLLTTIRSLI